MLCQEYVQLASHVESKRQAYTYIRLNAAQVHISKERYEELVEQGYSALTAAIKELGWHKSKCSVCSKHPAARLKNIG